MMNAKSAGIRLLSLALALGGGCTNAPQQQPKPTAAGTIDNRPPKGDLTVGWGGESTPNSDANAQPASVTSRGAAIEHDLDGKFNRAAADQ